MVIEIDGEYHMYKLVRDEERTHILNSFNIIVIRFSNDEVIYHIDDVKSRLEYYIQKREKDLFSCNPHGDT